LTGQTDLGKRQDVGKLREPLGRCHHDGHQTLVIDEGQAVGRLSTTIGTCPATASFKAGLTAVGMCVTKTLVVLL
jgi:hypothetical protein